MDRYHSVLDESLDVTTRNENHIRKKLLNTPSPSEIASRQKSTSRATEFTPILHTVKKIQENNTPPAIKQFQSNGRPKSLLNYSRDVNDNSSGMISLSGLSQSSDSSVIPQTAKNGIHKKTIVAEDPNNIPLREQARHVDALEKQNTDLKLKLQLMTKKLISVTRGEPLTDVTNTIESEQWKAKYEALLRRYETAKQGEDTNELQRRVTDLENDLEDRDIQISNYADKMETYENQIETLTDELEDLRKTSSREPAVEPQHNDERIEDLEYEKRRLEEIVEKLESENELLRGNDDQLTDEIENLKDQLRKESDSERKLQLVSSQLKDANDQIEFLKKNAIDKSNLSIRSSVANISRNYEHDMNILQQEIQQLKLKENENSQEIREKRDEIDSLRQELITANALARRLKNDADTAQKEKDYYETQLKEAQKKVLRLSKDANETIMARYDEQEVERLKKQLDSASLEAKENKTRWENEKNNLNERLRHVERLKESTDRQMAALLSRASNSSHLNDVLNTERTKFQQEKEMLQKEITSLKQQLNFLETDKNTQQSRYDQLKKQFDEKVLLQDAADRTANVTEFKIETLKDQQQQQQKEAFKLQSEIDTLNIKIDAMSKLHEVDKEKLITLEQEYESAVSKIKTLESELNVSEKTIRRLESKLTESETKLVEIEQKESNEDDIHHDFKKAQTNLHAARIYSKDLEQEIEHLRQKISNIKKENSRMKREYQDIRQQLTQQKIYHDHSITPIKGLSPEKEQKYNDLWNLYGCYVRFNKLHLRREIEAKEDLELTKAYLMAKNGKFLQSNMTTLALFADIGLYPDYAKLAVQKRTFRAVAYTVLATKIFHKRLEDRKHYRQEYKKIQQMRVVWNEQANVA